jgi:hypothetical protein
MDFKGKWDYVSVSYWNKRIFERYWDTLVLLDTCRVDEGGRAVAALDAAVAVVYDRRGH